MKKLITNKYANLYLNAADTLGLQYEILNEEAALIHIFSGSKSVRINANVLDLNSQISSSLATNKKKTSILLQENNIPVPEFTTFESIPEAEKYALGKLKNNISIVLKPLSMSLSVGITVDPINEMQVKQAVLEAFNGSDEIIIEEFVRGKHYRITVVDDEVIAVTERLAGYVLPDGKKSIESLIKEKNRMRIKMDLPEIVLRERDIQHLQNDGIDLMKVYPKGKSIILQLGCDLDIGGERVRVDRDIIPQINIDLFIKAVQTLNLRFAGIDYISPDILKPYTEVDSAINEINSAPHQDVHLRDSSPSDNYSAERIIKKMFEDNTSLNAAPLLSQLEVTHAHSSVVPIV